MRGWICSWQEHHSCPIDSKTPCIQPFRGISAIEQKQRIAWRDTVKFCTSTKNHKDCSEKIVLSVKGCQCKYSNPRVRTVNN